MLFSLQQMTYTFLKIKKVASFDSQVISEGRGEGRVLKSFKFWHLDGFP